MKTYYIKSTHDVYVDSYTDGELENVNFYQQKNTVNAKDAKQAIQKYFENTLYYSFEFEYAQIDDDYKNILHYSNLVDTENSEASKGEIELWKEGKYKLYSNNTTLEICELTEIEILN